MRNLAAVAILAIPLFLAGPASAGPFEDAVAAYRQGDYETARGLFAPLAGKGHANAQYNMGLLYANGHGVRQDKSAAAEWFGKAAEQGHAAAQYNLGLMAGVGFGVPFDRVTSYMWLDLAASGFPASEESDRRDAVWYKNVVASEMTPEEIAEAQRRVREWKPKR